MEATILYKKGGRYRGPGSNTHDFQGAKTQEEFDALKARGYCETMAEAMDEKPAEVVEVVEESNEIVAVSKEIKPAPFVKREELSDNQIDEITDALQDGALSDKEIASGHNLHHKTLSAIKADVL